MEVGMKTSMVGVKEGEACAWERRVSACSTSPGYHPATLPQSRARPKVDLCASGAKKALCATMCNCETESDRQRICLHLDAHAHGKGRDMVYRRAC